MKSKVFEILGRSVLRVKWTISWLWWMLVVKQWRSLVGYALFVGWEKDLANNPPIDEFDSRLNPDPLILLNASDSISERHLDLIGGWRELMHQVTLSVPESASN